MTTEQAPHPTPDMPSDVFTDSNAPFISGIDTRLNINKADSQNEKLQSLGFLSFLEEVQVELHAAVAVFINVNGHDPAQIKKDQIDLNHLFAKDPNYQDFLALFARTKANIEQWVAEDNPEPLAHQAIVDQVIGLRAFIEARYATPAAKPAGLASKRKVGHYFGAGILFFPIVFAWFTLRKGYSNWLRIGAFIWLGVFLYFTLPSPKEELEPAPTVTQALPPSEAATRKDQESDVQQEIEQEEKQQLDFEPQELEPQIAR